MEIVVLSDTESISSTVTSTHEANENNDLANELQDDDSDFDFPAVNFHYISEKNINNAISQDSAFGSFEFEADKNYRREQSNDCAESSKNENSSKKQRSRRKNKSKASDEENEIRESVANTKAREKALKKLAAKSQKSLKPEEAIKSMHVIIDERIKSSPFATDLTVFLQNYNIFYKFEDCMIPYSISWVRNMEKHFLDELDVRTFNEVQEETNVIVIWDWEEVVRKIVNISFVESIADIHTVLPNKIVTLIIYGMNKYFHFHKQNKQNDRKESNNGQEKKKRKNKNEEDIYLKAPKITNKNFNNNLVDIQIMYNVTSRLLETSDEIALMIYQFTKSLANKPYKLETAKKWQDMNWYALGDNKDCVKVDKDGNGLKRLWQRQLCQFNLSSLETAQAISSIYASPMQLMEAYANCTPAEGEMLLKDIPIRRTAGPLTGVRKIGPELSKKLYIMFTSENGNEILGNV